MSASNSYLQAVDRLRPALSRDEIMKSALPLEISSVAGHIRGIFPEELEILHAVGVAPGSGVRKFIDPFNGGDKTEDWSNVGSHCLAVAWCAAAVTAGHAQLGKIDKQIRRAAIKRALLHDALKPYEIFLCHAFNDGKIPLDDYYSPEIYHRLHDTLRRSGVEEKWIKTLVDDFGKENDVRTCFNNLLVIDSTGPARIEPGLTPGKVVHFADNMTYSPVPERGNTGIAFFMTAAERFVAAENARRYPWAQHAGAGIDRQRKLIHVEDVAEPPAQVEAVLCYHDLLIWVSHEIAKEISGESGIAADRAVADTVNSLIPTPAAALKNL